MRKMLGAAIVLALSRSVCLLWNSGRLLLKMACLHLNLRARAARRGRASMDRMPDLQTVV